MPSSSPDCSRTSRRNATAESFLPSLWTCGACWPAVRLMRTGLEGNRALDLGLVNKSFDDFERQLVRDVIRTRLPETLRREDVFD